MDSESSDSALIDLNDRKSDCFHRSSSISVGSTTGAPTLLRFALRRPPSSRCHSDRNRLDTNRVPSAVCPASAGNGEQRSSVKTTERTYEEGTEPFHPRRKSSHPEAA